MKVIGSRSRSQEPKSLNCAGIGIFYLFGSCNLDLDPITFIYELDP